MKHPIKTRVGKNPGFLKIPNSNGFFVGFLFFWSNLGELRTFAKLKKLYGSFAENGSKKCSIQLHKNVIHPCLLDEAGDMHVLDVIPPPELHLLMKIVTKISRVLCKEPDITVWQCNCGIIWHGYNGGGLDGRNANKIRKLLPNLEEHIFDHFLIIQLLIC